MSDTVYSKNGEKCKVIKLKAFGIKMPFRESDDKMIQWNDIQRKGRTRFEERKRMSYKTESYNSLATATSPSCEVWVMQRPDFNTMNAGLNAIVRDYYQMRYEIKNMDYYTKAQNFVQIDKDELELLRAKAWAFDNGSQNFLWQSEEQLLAWYRDSLK